MRQYLGKYLKDVLKERSEPLKHREETILGRDKSKGSDVGILTMLYHRQGRTD